MPESHTPTFSPAALLAAILLPGAGHVVAGERTRGLWISSGVLGLFFGGLLIGGIDAVDSKEDRIWFVGQALVGPLAFAVDYAHQNHFKIRSDQLRGRGYTVRSADPGEGRKPDGTLDLPGTPPNEKSIAKVNELGTLFATIAGMLNLIAIIDIAAPTSRGKAKA